eukprot:2959679-Pleurochrysis_carterae.AAC.2
MQGEFEFVISNGAMFLRACFCKATQESSAINLECNILGACSLSVDGNGSRIGSSGAREGGAEHVMRPA